MVVGCILNSIKSLGNCLSLLWEVTQATRVVVIPSMPKCLIPNICGEKICNISCICLMHFKDVSQIFLLVFVSIFAHCHESWKTKQLKLQNTKKDFDDQIPFKKYPKMSKMSFARNGCGVLHYLGVSGLNCLSLH